MESKIKKSQTVEPLNLLLIGNNPIEMSSILEKLRYIPGKKIITEIAFDLRTLFDRLATFTPNFILIDDNIGRAELSETVTALAQNRKTQNIPITVLKNSNYQEAYGAISILDYILKKNLSADLLLTTLRNTLKLKRTQLYLHQAYSKRKAQLLELVR